MPRKSGQQKGAQRHAEGAHGQRTHDAIMRQINSGSARARPERLGAEAARGDSRRDSYGARHRLDADRQQHDEAEKNSEKNQREGAS